MDVYCRFCDTCSTLSLSEAWMTNVAKTWPNRGGAPNRKNNTVDITELEISHWESIFVLK